MEELKISGREQDNTANSEQSNEVEVKPFNEEEAKKAVAARREEIASKETLESTKLLSRMDKLRSIEIPEGKLRLPAECYDEVASLIQKTNTTETTGLKNQLLKQAEREVSKLEELEGTIDKDIGEKLWSLYSDPDISIGIHGTIAEADSAFGTENSPIFTSGLGCAYKDMRRTVAFQDRGRIHAHGNISFLDLLSYDYPSSLQKQPLTLEKRIKRNEKIGHGTHVSTITHFDKVDVPARQYSVIVAIPKTVSTTDSALFGEEITVTDNNPFKNSQDKKAKTIKSEFIVGVISDSDPNSIVWSPSFDSERVKRFGHQRELEIQEKELRQQEEERKQLEQQSTLPEKESWTSKLFGRFKKQNH